MSQKDEWSSIGSIKCCVENMEQPLRRAQSRPNATEICEVVASVVVSGIATTPHNNDTHSLTSGTECLQRQANTRTAQRSSAKVLLVDTGSKLRVRRRLSMSGMNVIEVYASHLMRFPGEILYFPITVVIFSSGDIS